MPKPIIEMIQEQPDPATVHSDMVRVKVQEAVILLDAFLTQNSNGPIGEPLSARSTLSLASHHLDSALFALSKLTS
jgi:hypothetical protein